MFAAARLFAFLFSPPPASLRSYFRGPSPLRVPIIATARLFAFLFSRPPASLRSYFRGPSPLRVPIIAAARLFAFLFSRPLASLRSSKTTTVRVSICAASKTKIPHATTGGSRAALPPPLLPLSSVGCGGEAGELGIYAGLPHAV